MPAQRRRCVHVGIEIVPEVAAPFRRYCFPDFVHGNVPAPIGVDERCSEIVAQECQTGTHGALVLEAAGAQVTTVGSPIAALDLVETLQPDALVVDLGMPEMDGFAFIARIRAALNPQIRDIPAAALTAFARSEDRTKALRSGFELHLAKPVDPGELVASVATLVRRSRTTRAPNA